MKIAILSLLLFITTAASTGLFAQDVAFPSAEGFGALATGGRGGSTYHVTNLSDSGTGSFRDAVSQAKRTIVFDVAGIIQLKDKVKAEADITIAGQTAPGDGIVVFGHGVSFSSNTIVRYIRFRGSEQMSRGACTVVIDDSKNVIFDHVTIGWGRWDNLHIKGSDHVTLQYCIIGEGIEPQKFGALFEGPTEVTVHHCLWINNQSRNPKAKAGIEYINNVVYNWGVSGFVGGHSAADHYQDVINNYFIAGPNSSNSFLAMFTNTDHVYHQGNYVDLNKDGQLNGRLVLDSDFVHQKADLKNQPNQHCTTPVKVDQAQTAYRKIIKEVGASMYRDSTDNRYIRQLLSLGKEGKIILTEAEVGGQTALQSFPKLKDSDGDGMPDNWEKSKGLNPNNASDAQQISTSKRYTNIEMYINSLTKVS